MHDLMQNKRRPTSQYEINSIPQGGPARHLANMSALTVLRDLQYKNIRQATSAYEVGHN